MDGGMGYSHFDNGGRRSNGSLMPGSALLGRTGQVAVEDWSAIQTDPAAYTARMPGNLNFYDRNAFQALENPVLQGTARLGTSHLDAVYSNSISQIYLDSLQPSGTSAQGKFAVAGPASAVNQEICLPAVFPDQPANVQSNVQGPPAPAVTETMARNEIIDTRGLEMFQRKAATIGRYEANQDPELDRVFDNNATNVTSECQDTDLDLFLSKDCRGSPQNVLSPERMGSDGSIIAGAETSGKHKRPFNSHRQEIASTKYSGSATQPTEKASPECGSPRKRKKSKLSNNKKSVGEEGHGQQNRVGHCPTVEYFQDIESMELETEVSGGWIDGIECPDSKPGRPLGGISEAELNARFLKWLFGSSFPKQWMK